MGLTLYQEDLQHVMAYIPEAGRERVILVTGASGLIGKMLVDACLFYNQCHEDKIFVYAMARDLGKLRDRLIRPEEIKHKEIGTDKIGLGEMEPKESGSGEMEPKGIGPEETGLGCCLELLAQDVAQPIKVEKECDYIIHMASPADPKSYARYPVETMKANINGTVQALEYAKNHKRCKNIVVASTMEVYGATENLRNKETDYGIIDFNDIRSGYPESKRVAELLSKSYAAEYGVASSAVRLGYVYGPTMQPDDSKVIAQFIRDILGDKPITLKSRGEQRRTWCYVADAAAAIFQVLFHGASGEAYNAANDDEVLSIREIAELASQFHGRETRMEAPAMEEKKGYSKPVDAVLDTAKLRGLGWQPKYSFKEGLGRTVRMMKDGKWYG